MTVNKCDGDIVRGEKKIYDKDGEKIQSGFIMKTQSEDIL